MVNLEKFNTLMGEEFTIIELSNYLIGLGCEDVCEFGNWSDLLNEGDVIVAIDEFADKNIHIFFKTVKFVDGGYQDIINSNIKILSIEEF